ncbi:hypothetical protein [Burkholderia gladioli]|uniref:hypothetical protein n=1 Tax=Burkholderia gladioli TaxID=28095 RepID=UPI003D35C453
MSESKQQWTPGPWYVIGKHPDCEIRYVGLNPDNRHSMEIAVLYGAEGDEQEANAKLIAAAPELVEALQALSVMWESVCDIQGWNVDAYAEYRAARAALAKAGAIDQLRAANPVAEAARHPTICSFCLEPNCNGECSGDGGMGD